MSRISNLVLMFFLLTLTLSYSQDDIARNRSDLNDKNYNSWSVGGGITNFIMHGDLRSLGTGEQGSYFNFGGYAYVNKMFNPVVGVEFKLNYNTVRGGAQYLSDVYDIVYVNDTQITNNLFFEGRSIGGELNGVISISNLFIRKKRKLNISAIFGLGYHIYNSALFEETPTGINPLVDFGSNPARNSEKNASSVFLTSQLSFKYRFNQKIDFEFRASLYVNNEDHLDAAISNKQDYELFFVNHIGVVYKLGKKKSHLLWSIEKDGGRIVVENKSKLKDTDKDGVTDEFDVEPGTPEGVMVYGNGKAIDSDKDGLADYKDDCPLKPGPVENKGCPVLKDTDKDGLYDFEDLCPEKAGPKENRGCPIPEKKEPESVTIIRYISELAANVYFDTAKWSIKAESIETLDKIASYMDKIPDIKFRIEGHTDDRSSDKFNLFLSQKRADAVYKYLLRQGIKADRLSFRGYGESRPKYSNLTPEGRQLNRRVEIKPQESLEGSTGVKTLDNLKGDKKVENKEGGEEKKEENKEN